MSTRSFVGKINSDGTFKARYVHSDGYPTYLARQLLALVQRDDAEKVLSTVTEEHYGWSSLNAETPDIEGVTPDRDADFRSAEYQASRFQDGRFANIPGYGIAYTTQKGQSSPDDWVEGGVNLDTEEGMGDFGWVEWGYLIDSEENSILVLRTDGQFFHPGSNCKVAGRVPFDAEEVDELLATVECGENYEYCSHYAWVHFDVPDESKRLSTAEWLEHEQMNTSSAIAVTVDGSTYQLTGGGVSSGYHRNLPSYQNCALIKPGKGWLSDARSDDGEPVLVRTRTETGNPVRGVQYHYPQTVSASA